MVGVTERLSVGLSSRGAVRRTRNIAGKINETLDSVSRSVEFLGHWEVALGTTIAIVLIVICARYYFSSITGYIVPDEAFYYNTYILEKASITSYRPAFVATFILFFHGAKDVWTFLLLGALYSAIWAVGSIVILLMILRRLKVPENTLSLLVLSLPLFPVFTVFAATILTETPGLFMALVGLYFALRHVQEGRMVNSLLSSVFFILAYMMREPYLLFVVGNALLFLILSLKRRSLVSILGYAIPFFVIFALAGGQAAVLLKDAFRIQAGVFQPDLPRALAIGLGYGFNPLFAVFAVLSLLVVSFDLFKKRSSTALFLVLNAVWSFGAFALSTGFLLASIADALSGWTSSIIRASHISLTAIIGFPSLYRRLKTKVVVAFMMIVLILSAIMAGSVVGAYQRSLSVIPVNRLSLDYRAPYYRMYLLAKDSGKTLIFGGLHMRGIRMYAAMLPNVVLVPSKGISETNFRKLLAQGWDSIFIYDDWVTIAVPSMINAYPGFFADMLRSKQYPGYSIQTLWIDGESYALKMVKVSSSSQINGASMVSNDIPTSMTSAQTYTVHVTVQNTGTTWTAAGNYKLGANITAPYGPTRVLLDPSASVGPSQQYTFTFTLTAPTPGTYTLRYEMVRELVAWFGQTLTVNVVTSTQTTTTTSSSSSQTATTPRTPMLGHQSDLHAARAPTVYSTTKFWNAHDHQLWLG